MVEGGDSRRGDANGISGLIALPEHMAKAIICGADLVAVDIPLVVAMECRLCGSASAAKRVRSPWSAGRRLATRRIVNLIGAWHQQLIEVLGAMGIREVRRFRGETGRAMFFETWNGIRSERCSDRGRWTEFDEHNCLEYAEVVRQVRPAGLGIATRSENTASPRAATCLPAGAARNGARRAYTRGRPATGNRSGRSTTAASDRSTRSPIAIAWPPALAKRVAGGQSGVRDPG